MHDSYKKKIIIHRLSCDGRWKGWGGEIEIAPSSFQSHLQSSILTCFVSAFFVPIRLLLLLYLIQFIWWSLAHSVFPLSLFNSPPHPTSFFTFFFFFFYCRRSKRHFVIRGQESVCFNLLQSLTSDSFALTDSSLQDIRSCLARQLASFNAHHWSRNSLAHTTRSYDCTLIRTLI